MKLKGKKAALLAEDNYNDFELWIPYYRLKEEGVNVTVVGSGSASVYHSKYGIPVQVDKSASEVTADDFDAVVIPLADTLRTGCACTRQWWVLSGTHSTKAK